MELVQKNLNTSKVLELEEERFSYLDQFFAKQMLKRHSEFSEEIYVFFCFLMASFRMGHLCVKIDKREVFPTLSLSKPMLDRIRQGAELLPPIFANIVIQEDNRYYLQKNWILETKIVKGLQKKTATNPPNFFDEELFQDHLDQLIECKAVLQSQAEAIRLTYSHSLTMICGGPGTGKSYTAVRLIEVLAKSWKNERSFRVTVIAPTGKAATLLGEKIKQVPLNFERVDIAASTIHAVLKIPYQISENFQPRTIESDLVIVDESSMIDPKIMAYLIEALPSTSRLVLMGDPDQLPSIEGGSVFSDLKKVAAQQSLSFCQILDKPMRFEKSAIYEFAMAVNEGNSEGGLQLLDQPNEHLSFTSMEHAEELIEESLSRWIQPQKEELDPLKFLQDMDGFRILSCLRHGPLGVDTINRKIYEKISQNIPTGFHWAAPILVTRNDPKKGIYNGMMGILVGAKKEETKSDPFFKYNDLAYFLGADGIFAVSLYALPRWEFAFCLSVHKSQGSEFQDVYLLAPPGSETFGRELFYTAATRAKRNLKICSDLETVKIILKKKTEKISGIQDRWQK